MKKVRFFLAMLPLLGAIGIVCLLHPWQQAPAWFETEERSVALLLDAGHGGEDGGALSVCGAKESEINLAITLKMEQILALLGQPPQLLRQDDRSLHDASADTLREKKASDLKNRVAMVNAVEQAILVSIHQNSFSQAQYHGAQVFYAPTDRSQAMAVQIQAVIAQSLQPDNERQAKQIPAQVYLMNHVSCPAVLVECGFLSNQEEAQLLETEQYQLKLATVLSSAILTALETSPMGAS